MKKEEKDELKNQNISGSDLVEYIKSSIEVIVGMKLEEKETCDSSFQIGANVNLNKYSCFMIEEALHNQKLLKVHSLIKDGQKFVDSIYSCKDDLSLDL